MPEHDSVNTTLSLRRWIVVGALWLGTGLPAQGWAQTQLPVDTLPPTVRSLLEAARLPVSALSAWVSDVSSRGPVWLSHGAAVPVNPASTLKLVTTFAALDRLGPAHVWRTRVASDGVLRDGVLQGNLYLQGQGDPRLVSEKLWLLLRRVQGQGIQRIAGDIVLDRSAYAVPDGDPGAFDGEPLKPYNATPDALLVNYKTQVFSFVPDVATGVARLALEPPLAGVKVPASVPLVAGPCNDWRASLKGDFTDPLQPRFLGAYPVACGERSWPLAHPEPALFTARAVEGMWRAMGAQLDGRVRDGLTPPDAVERTVLESPPLAEIVRDVNKFSNNVMAQQVFLALGQGFDAMPGGRTEPASLDASRRLLEAWWPWRIGADVPVPLVGNGAGLSRDARVTVQALARVLQVVWSSPLMPDMIASLPASGQDGTLRRSSMGQGLAHLKTGSLRDVQALAGYVHGPDGQRRVLVAIVNHPNARAARPALDALVQWAAGR